MIREFPIKSRRQQTGAVTLIVTLLIVVAITIGSFAMVHTSTMESRMTANDHRSREALQAAQSGIDYVLAALAAVEIDRDFLCSSTTLSTHRFQLNFTGPDPASGQLDFANQEPACQSMPFELVTKLSVWSRGYSLDGESMRTLVSTIDLTTPWEFNLTTKFIEGDGSGTAPVVARGNVHFQGTPEVARCATMDSCEDLARPGNQTGVHEGTLVMAGGTVTAQGNVPMGSEHYDQNNADLAAMSGDQLFSDFASGGLSKEQFRTSEFTHQYTPSQGNNQITTNKNQIWVDGDISLRNGTIGSPDKPVILVVNGDLTLAGNVIIWGVVYAASAEFSAGTNKIMGSLITEGSVDMKGNAAVYYNPDLRPAPESGVDPDAALAGYSAAREASVRVGSWREVVN
jgi:hypothetical protein